MSPTSRKRATKKKPRSTPKREPTVAEIFDEMVAGFADVATSADALRAELMASQLLGVWWTTGPAGIELVGGGAVEHAERVGDANALAMLTGLGSVATGELATRAATAAQVLRDAGVPAPAWADTIGRAVPGECWCWGDVFGDVLSVFCRFDGPMGEHAIVVLVDRTGAGDVVEDAWAVTDPEAALAETRQAFAESEDADLVEVRPIDPAQARLVIERAFRALDEVPDRPVAEDLPDFRALVLARCRLLPEPAAPANPGAEEQARLVAEFVADTGASRHCAELYVGYCADLDTADPLRVSAAVVDQFFGDAAAEELDEEDIEAMPDTVTAFVRWAAAKRGLSDHALEVAMEQVEQSANDFRAGEFDWIDLPPSSSDSYVLRATVQGTRDSQTLTVPGDLTMDALNDRIQQAFAWEGTDPHTFTAGALTAGTTTDVDLDESDVTLSQLAPNPGMHIDYAAAHNVHLTVVKVEPTDDVRRR